MRQQALGSTLGTLLLLLAVAGVGAGDNDITSEDEQLLRSAGLSTDMPHLVAFLRTRSRTAPEPGRIAHLIKQLGSQDAGPHRTAAAELVAWGSLALPALRELASDLAAPEAAARARRCLEAIQGKSGSSLPLAAARLLAAHKAEGTAAALLGYLPFADPPESAEEIIGVLTSVAMRDGRPEPAVVRALEDTAAIRRAAACAALCHSPWAGRWRAVRPLLEDKVPAVRLRAALALVEAQDAAAIPVLIDLLAELPAGNWHEAEEALRQVAGAWAPAVGSGKEDELARRIRRDAWAAWWRATDGPALLAALRKRTPTKADRGRARALIERLGDDTFAIREKATADLVALGVVALPLLRQALVGTDPETARRARECIDKIEHEPAQRLPVEALRLLTLRRPAGAAEALLAYLPYAEDESLETEAKVALAAAALTEGKLEAALVKALSEGEPSLRAAAAEALVRGGGEEGRIAVRPLLHDTSAEVRLRSALALATAGERDGVPALIELLGVLPAARSEEAEVFLRQLAGDKAPAEVTDSKARARYRDAWAAWWRAHGATLDLTADAAPSQRLGYTLIMLGGNPGSVFEVGRDGKKRWSIDNVAFPVDGWVLPGGRVLIAEYSGHKVTERTFKGEIKWEKAGLPGQPVNVQRLGNGHTFIATDSHVLEVDRMGKEVYSFQVGEGITAAYKASAGQVLCLTQNGQCVRMDTRGKHVRTFSSNRSAAWTSGLDLLPGGRVLITQPNRNKVAEMDGAGKVLREVDAPSVTTATGTADGRVILASNSEGRVWEVDRAGKVVWEQKGLGSPFRARRR